MHPGFKGLVNRACEMDRRRDDVADGTLKVYDARSEPAAQPPHGPDGLAQRAIGFRRSSRTSSSISSRSLRERGLHRHQQRLGATSAPLRRLSQDHQRLSHEWGAELYADIRSVVEVARRRSMRAIDAIYLTLKDRASLAQIANSNREVSNYDQRLG